MGPRQRAHFPAASQKIRGSRSVELQHVRAINGEPGPKERRNLTACHNSSKLAAGRLVPNIFRKDGTKWQMPARQPPFIHRDEAQMIPAVPVDTAAIVIYA
jgi:hypothetical protein